MASILSVEFTDTECKIVVADQAKNGRITLKSLSSFELPRPDDPAAKTTERANALRDHLKAQRILIKNCVVVIPKNFVMARTVTLPSTVDDEIAGMAKFEADRHIPFNADRHIVSYHVLSRQGMQGSDVLLAAVDQPIAQEYLDVCVKAGLKVSSITVSSLAMFNSFANSEKTAMADRTIMVLNVGKGATDLVIATNGHVTFTRGSTTGVMRLLTDLSETDGKEFSLSDLSDMDALEPQLYFRDKTQQPPPTPAGLYDELPDEDASDSGLSGSVSAFPTPPPSAATAPENKTAIIFTDWLNKVLQEVKRTIEFANREFNSPMVSQIYLSGEGSLIPKMAQFFQANFNVDASVFNPLDGADVPRKITKNNEDIGRRFAVAIGGVVGKQPNTVHINLLPGSYTEAWSAKRQQRSYIVTGVLALVALIAGYMYLSDAFARKRSLLDDLAARNKSDRARVDDLRTKKERLRIIRENVQDDRGALDVLRILSEKPYFPDTVSLTSFDYKRGDYVKLEGDAKDLPSANTIVNDMRNTGFFEEAKLDDAVSNKTLRNRPPVAVTGWKATFTFPKPEKPKSKSKSSSREKESTDGTE